MPALVPAVYWLGVGWSAFVAWLGPAWEWVVWSGNALAAVFTAVVLAFNVVLMVQAARQRKDQNREFEEGRERFAQEMRYTAEANKLGAEAQGLSRKSHALAIRSRADEVAPRVGITLDDFPGYHWEFTGDTEHVASENYLVRQQDMLLIRSMDAMLFKVQISFNVDARNYGTVPATIDVPSIAGVDQYHRRLIIFTGANPHKEIGFSITKTAEEWLESPNVEVTLCANVTDPWGRVTDSHTFEISQMLLHSLPRQGLGIPQGNGVVKLSCSGLAKVKRSYAEVDDE